MRNPIWYLSMNKNNFNLIRLLAPLLILFYHCYPLSLTQEFIDPITRILHFHLGTVGLYSFMVRRGFLATKSFSRTSSVSAFLAGRMLRIYPALIGTILVYHNQGYTIKKSGVQGFLLAKEHPVLLKTLIKFMVILSVPNLEYQSSGQLFRVLLDFERADKEILSLIALCLFCWRDHHSFSCFFFLPLLRCKAPSCEKASQCSSHQYAPSWSPSWFQIVSSLGGNKDRFALEWGIMNLKMIIRVLECGFLQRNQD